MPNNDIQDQFLTELVKQSSEVNIFLKNGIKLQGKITAFDQFVVVLSGPGQQMIFKHAISTVVPAQYDPSAGR